MKLISRISDMQEISDYYRATGKKIAFVPTMGFLHEGHTSLMLNARDTGDIVVASIFVNPTQFGKDEDFEKYPRDFERDSHICENSGVDYIFHPDAGEMYPGKQMITVKAGEISEKLEGKYRPGHFDGVATVVSKLINIVKPHTMHMGSKDAQQNAVIRRMISDLNFETRLIVCPTIREKNGLAMSSRNTYLTPEELNEAGALYHILKEGKRLIDEGTPDVETVKQHAFNELNEKAPNIELQYYEITDNVMLDPITDTAGFTGEMLISLAAQCGKARLIDNIIFEHTPVK